MLATDYIDEKAMIIVTVRLAIPEEQSHVFFGFVGPLLAGDGQLCPLVEQVPV